MKRTEHAKCNSMDRCAIQIAFIIIIIINMFSEPAKNTGKACKITRRHELTGAIIESAEKGLNI